MLFLVLLLCAGFALLGFRLVNIQVLRHEELKAKAEDNYRRKFLHEPRRGDILDAQGNPLATSVFMKTICANPMLVGNRHAEVARVVAPILGLNEAEVQRQLMPRMRTNTNGTVSQDQYEPLKRNVPAKTWERLRFALTNMTFGLDEERLSKKEREFFKNLRNKAVYAEAQETQLRVYPNQSMAAHVLGYVGITDTNCYGKPVREMVGMDGIERIFHESLTGVRGWRITELDGDKNEVVTFRDQDVEPRDGNNVVLTVDSVIQNILENALRAGMKQSSPISISAIALRPKTGEILAMATLPSFDPNNLASSSADARRNRIITDLIEPGSTFKIVVVSGGLNEKEVTLADRIFCENGAFNFEKRTLHDHDPYGWLTVEEIITKSSNIGSAKIGIKLGKERLHRYIYDFGFGRRTGITLPGEVVGIVRPTKNWYPVSLAQIPMGHGICVTPLQMAMAMSAIANEGVLMRPMLVSRIVSPDGQIVARNIPQRVRQVIFPAAAKQMVQALRTVATKDGTAPKAEMKHYTVAGKTGTAWKVENGAYVRGKYISSFIGFLPADRAELCIAVFLDEPKGAYYGGLTAAPVFREIAERAASYLNIPPDRAEEPGRQGPFEIQAEGPSLRAASVGTPRR